ncbi:hypothetical protein PX701_00755 [Agromyces sp. H3Y2-19a]|uniref:hypothetical protein n=1 Tax=Agromyces TaxID=33877 RepID=UPI001E61D6F4|nr:MULTISPECIES: hypothetical protein [Agromyces]MCD5345771.1 hypothetical protein [Agromyces sp. S2-1-8]MDF0512137.1 hypothetical protein [Agromyces chromiiresistens]
MNGDGGARPRFFARPRVRLVVSRVLVAVGLVLGVIGVVSGRYGWLFAGIVVVGLGAASGPSRLRR